jgi:hypothetical protein
MVWALVAFFDNFEKTVQVAAALEQDFAQAVAVQVVGTGARQQHPVLRQHLHRHLVQPLAAKEFQVFARIVEICRYDGSFIVLCRF